MSNQRSFDHCPMCGMYVGTRRGDDCVSCGWQPEVIGYIVAGNFFDTFEKAQDFRSAQIWDGGVGMLDMPDPVFE